MDLPTPGERPRLLSQATLAEAPCGRAIQHAHQATLAEAPCGRAIQHAHLASGRFRLLVLCACIVAVPASSSLAPADGGPGRQEEAAAPRPAPVAPRVHGAAPSVAAVLAGLDLGATEVVDGITVQRTADGRRIELTLDPELQRGMTRLLRENQVPAGVAVALDSRTGRVLALAEHGGTGLWAVATAPAASVFKVVTASALVEKAGIGPDEEVCYGGGSHELSARDLEDDRERDRQCATLAQAVGYSLNAVMAKLADRHLDRAALALSAEAFGWNSVIPFELPVEASRAEFPEDRLELARTAAGFWHTHLSPLHAAMVAQAIAQSGQMLRPWIVSRVTDASGQTVYQGSARFLRTAVTPATAQLLSRMMTITTVSGTSRRAFHDREGRPYLRGVQVAGKTGTLSARDPYRGYTWFVGFAPADAPRIAVATLVVNDPTWRIKASEVARELLQTWFREHP